MALVGILSDTHGVLPESAYAELADCDYIIHAGDICSPDILTTLRGLAPTAAVLGNNDYNEYGSDVGRFAHPEIEGVRFLVGHRPLDVRITYAGSAGFAPGDPFPDVCVHGHTHVPKLEFGHAVRPAQLLLCPGAVNRPRGEFGRTLAKVEVANGTILSARIFNLQGRVVMEHLFKEQ